MIYGYLVVLVVFVLVFALSRKENASEYVNQAGKKSYPGEIFFLRAALWCMRQKERLSEKYAGGGKVSREQFYKSRLGKKLKLLHPSVSEKQQVEEFYVRQYSLALLVLFAGNMLSFCVALSSRTDRLLQEGNYINRKGYGQGDIELTLLAEVDGMGTESIFYTVDEQKYSEEEVRRLYQEASAQLPEAILGENESLNAITEDLNLVTSIEGYPFKIEWESSSYSLVHTDGTVSNETMEKPEIAILRAYFRYEGMEFEEEFPVQIQPAVLTEEELLLKSIEASLEEQNQVSRTGSAMILPDYIENKKIVWKEVVQDNSGYFFLLICAASVLIFLSKGRDVEQELEKRKKELLLDYPEVVSKLTLYMGAGMTIRSAFFKMGEDYKRKETSNRKRYVYEEILLLVNELQSGISETEAYVHLGKRCQLQPYMKLSALLSQNLRKGSNDLLMMLRQEASAAFEERKNTARKLGEEAGTKLLMPMMMMLCIVMVIIMFPAFCSF